MVIHTIGFQENASILSDSAIRALFVISRSTVQIRPPAPRNLTSCRLLLKELLRKASTMPGNSTSFYVYKRSNQIYYIGYYDRGKLRWKSTGVKTKSEAHKALTRFRELLLGQTVAVTLEQFIDQFLCY